MRDRSEERLFYPWPACAPLNLSGRKVPASVFRGFDFQTGLFRELFRGPGPNTSAIARVGPFSGLVQPKAYLLAPLRSAAKHPLLLGREIPLLFSFVHFLLRLLHRSNDPSNAKPNYDLPKSIQNLRLLPDEHSSNDRTTDANGYGGPQPR